jgi:hypothetical protein
MADNKQFRTGDRVQATGEYESEHGNRRQYKEGDLFEACPGTGKHTNWRSCIVQ